MTFPNKVDEEYINALRTKSYADLYAKVHDEAGGGVDESESYRIRHPCRRLVPEFLLEPSQESLVAAANSGAPVRSRGRFHGRLNDLLLDFFDATLHACAACSTLLASIDSARSHHRSIHRSLVRLTHSSSETAFSQLSSHLELDNPLSQKVLSQFHLIHSRYPPLVCNLTSAHRRVVRRQKLVRFAQKVSGMAVVVLLGAIVVAPIAIATHGAAAAVAVAPLASAAPVRGRAKRWVRGWTKLERARARMDVAAKGAYIVGRDLDTMSRMVRRVHDEVEHGREVGRMVVRNREWRMAVEVVREMEGRGGGEVGMGVEEQLEELEEHVYLCLITINRSRRLVAQEMADQHPPQIAIIS